MHKRTNERTKERTNEWMKAGWKAGRKKMSQSINRSKNERTNGWVSYFFVELLHWATASLRCVFLQLLLLWAASHLGYFSDLLRLWAASLSQLPLLHAASAAQFLPSHGQRYAFCTLQAQSDPAQEWHYASLCSTTTVFAAATVFSNLQLQSRKAGALQTPVFNHFKMQIELKLHSRALFVGYLLMWMTWWCGWPDGWHDLDPSAQTPISGFKYI